MFQIKATVSSRRLKGIISKRKAYKGYATRTKATLNREARRAITKNLNSISDDTGRLRSMYNQIAKKPNLVDTAHRKLKGNILRGRVRFYINFDFSRWEFDPPNPYHSEGYSGPGSYAEAISEGHGPSGGWGKLPNLTRLYHWVLSKGLTEDAGSAKKIAKSIALKILIGGIAPQDQFDLFTRELERSLPGKIKNAILEDVFGIVK